MKSRLGAIVLALFLAGCSIPLDKQLHAGAGAFVAQAGHKAGLTWQTSCLLASGVGLGKEVWDSTGRGHVDVKDFAYTAAAGCAMAWLLERR